MQLQSYNEDKVNWMFNRRKSITAIIFYNLCSATSHIDSSMLDFYKFLQVS